MTTPSFDFDILHRPDFALLSVRLRQGEQIFAEPAAMVTMDPEIELKAGLRGGVLRSIGRALGGESFIINTFSARQRAGEISFAPGPMGDIVHYRVSRESNLLLQRGSFLAHGPGVEINARWDGMRGFFSGEGMILLRASGDGDLFFNTYGALIPVDVHDEYIVDTGYIVAFEDTLNYSISTLPGGTTRSKIKSFFFGGEGLVCRFTGQGRLWIQTRVVHPFLNWVHPFRPAPKSNN